MIAPTFDLERAKFSGVFPVLAESDYNLFQVKIVHTKNNGYTATVDLNSLLSKYTTREMYYGFTGQLPDEVYYILMIGDQEILNWQRSLKLLFKDINQPP